MACGDNRPEAAPTAREAVLAPYRRELDAIDDRIGALLGERFGIIRQVAAVKAANGIPAVLPERIEIVVERARETAGRAGYPADIAEKIYRILIDAACRLETDLIAQGEAPLK